MSNLGISSACHREYLIKWHFSRDLKKEREQKKQVLPWPAWPSGQSVSLQARGSWVLIPAKSTYLIHVSARGNPCDAFPSRRCFSPPLLSPLCKKISEKCPRVRINQWAQSRCSKRCAAGSDLPLHSEFPSYSTLYRILALRGSRSFERSSHAPA